MPDIRNICSDKLINMGTEFGGEDFISTCGYRNVLSLKRGTKKLWKESVTEAAISSTNNQVFIFFGVSRVALELSWIHDRYQNTAVHKS